MNLKRLNFLKNIRVSQENRKNEWKEPNLESEIYYNGIKVPTNTTFLLVNEKSSKYVGNNKYIINIDNLSLEEQIKLSNKISNNIVDYLGVMLLETEKKDEYIEFSHRYNSNANLINFNMKNGNNEKAFKKQEQNLTAAIKYYNYIKETYIDVDKEIEER